MLLFKPEHVELILSGQKTQTRRLWPHGCRVKVGNVYQCRTRMMDKASTFARIRVKRIWREQLGEIQELNAHEEGYPSRAAYIEAFRRINGHAALDTVVWAVEFEIEAT